MNARDELAGIMSSALHGPKDGTNITRLMTDAVLAAGWAKPRTITTVEELDALPPGSVVRIQQDMTLERFSDGWFTSALTDKFTAYPIWLPAVVLYEPESLDKQMSKPIHRINEAGTSAICAAPADADCRKRSHCDSEGWHFDTGCTEHEGKHPALPGSDCWMTEYINSIELTETFEDYENPPEIIPGAAIDLEFIGPDEGCCWAYAESTPVCCTAAGDTCSTCASYATEDGEPS